MRKTNPISGPPGPREHPIVRNEANFPGGPGIRHSKCAKRTQFRRSAMVPEDEMRKTNPIRWSQMCKTKPIPGYAGAAALGQSCETKPNLGELGYLGDGAWQEGPNAQNEPNLPGGAGRPPPRLDPPASPRQADCAKRSQFAIFRATRWARHPPPYAGTPHRRINLIDREHPAPYYRIPVSRFARPALDPVRRHDAQRVKENRDDRRQSA